MTASGCEPQEASLLFQARQLKPVAHAVREDLEDEGPEDEEMGAFRVTRIMLDEAGIRYTEVENLEAGEKGVLIQGVTYQYQKK